MATYFQIGSTVTVGAGGAATIDFTSIPSTYTDLILKLSVRGTQAVVANAVYISINTLTTNFSNRLLEGNGATASSTTSSPARFLGNFTGASATSNTFSSIEVYIPNYAGSTNKSYSIESATENSATTAYYSAGAGLWSSTSAITSIELKDQNAGNFVQYSHFALYGIKGA
jgi:hypothetical protein